MTDAASFGPYQVIRLLGEGGMGQVYLARQTVLDRDVVLKRIRPELATNAEIVRRFIVEAQAAAKLVHRHIVVVHDAATDPSGIPYIALEYLRGESLRDLLNRRRAVAGPFVPATRVALFLVQAGCALEFAHEHGVIHRDIKPDNVFLTGAPADRVWLLQSLGLPVEQFVKLLDFGIAKLARPGPSGTGTHAALGTPAYMPPEQLIGARDVDRRADVYALGAMCFEMLSGDVPWGTTTFAELHGRMMHEPTPDPRRLNPAVPKRVAQVVMRALKREPDDRWPTVADFVRAFAAEVPAGDDLPSGVELLRSYAHELSSPNAALPREAGPATEQQPGASAGPASLTPQAAVVSTAAARPARRGLAVALGASAAVGIGVLGVVLATSRRGHASTPPDASPAVSNTTAPLIDAAPAVDAATPPDAPSTPVDAGSATAIPLDAGGIDAPRHRPHRPSDPPGTGTGSSHGIRVIN